MADTEEITTDTKPERVQSTSEAKEEEVELAVTSTNGDAPKFSRGERIMYKNHDYIVCHANI